MHKFNFVRIFSFGERLFHLLSTFCAFFLFLISFIFLAWYLFPFFPLTKSSNKVTKKCKSGSGWKVYYSLTTEKRLAAADSSQECHGTTRQQFTPGREQTENLFTFFLLPSSEVQIAKITYFWLQLVWKFLVPFTFFRVSFFEGGKFMTNSSTFFNKK